MDMQALGIAGDNVTGDVGTPFAKMGNVPGCARLSFVKRVMPQATQWHILRKRVMSQATQSYLLRNE